MRVCGGTDASGDWCRRRSQPCSSRGYPGDDADCFSSTWRRMKVAFAFARKRVSGDLSKPLFSSSASPMATKCSNPSTVVALLSALTNESWPLRKLISDSENDPRSRSWTSGAENTTDRRSTGACCQLTREQRGGGIIFYCSRSRKRVSISFVMECSNAGTRGGTASSSICAAESWRLPPPRSAVLTRRDLPTPGR